VNYKYENGTQTLLECAKPDPNYRPLDYMENAHDLSKEYTCRPDLRELF